MSEFSIFDNKGMKPLIQLDGVTKNFAKNVVLSNVDFKLRAGEIHALCGENGAGKSTCLGLLYGLHQPTKGNVYVDGELQNIETPSHAQALGISCVFQELSLAGALSVAENIFAGRVPSQYGLVNWQELHRRAEALLDDFGLNIDVSMPVDNLPISSRQIVEIAKSLSLNSRILLLDDASPDERVWPLLEEFAREHSHVEALRAPENLGYTRNVNRGCRLAAHEAHRHAGAGGATRRRAGGGVHGRVRRRRAAGDWTWSLSWNISPCIFSLKKKCHFRSFDQIGRQGLQDAGRGADRGAGDGDLPRRRLRDPTLPHGDAVWLRRRRRVARAPAGARAARRGAGAVDPAGGQRVARPGGPAHHAGRRPDRPVGGGDGAAGGAQGADRRRRRAAPAARRDHGGRRAP